MSLEQFYYKHNRLQQLRGFYFAVRLKSISAAAKQLNVSQAAVTLQIQSLERDLKTDLFSREKRKIALTREGEALYDMIVPYIQGIDSVCDEFLTQRKNPTNEIHIAAHHIAISHLLPPYLKRFLKKHPQAKTHIHNLSRTEALERLKSGKLDFILYPNTPALAECKTKECFAFEPMLIMHPTHPLAKKRTIQLQDITAQNLIRIDPGLIELPLFEEVVQTYHWKGNIDFENGDWEMLKHFVRENIGIAMVSELCIDKADKTIVARSMHRFFPKMTYSISVKRDRHLPDIVKDFIAELDAGFFEEKKKANETE